MSREYTVADAVLDVLKHFKVSKIFGYPGGAILPFYDALPDHRDDIEHILVRHEQSAAFAAQGWARTKKELGVCCATSGPGATNLLTGIADAYMDSIPILCITGQVPLPMIGKDMFQEIDMTGVTLSITKHNFLVGKPEDIVKIMVEAINIAVSGRPGPVHIDIPKDIMSATHPKNFEIPTIDLINDPQQKAYYPLDNSIVQEVVDLMRQAKKPVLLVGQGVKLSSAEKELLEFIKQTNIPVVSTLLAKGVLDNNLENYLGMLGMHGLYASNEAVHNSDLIINIGSRFDDRIVGRYDVFSQNKKIIHVDIDLSEINKVVTVDLPIHSDAKQFLQQLLVCPELKKLNINDWWNDINRWKEKHPYQKDTNNFTIRSVLSRVSSLIEQDMKNFVVVTDVGQHQMWSSLSLSVLESVQWCSSGGAGTMGFSLPVSIGSAMANPDKTILCIAGDGGIQMNIQELQTIYDYQLNIKVLILNNSFLGMVRQWQELFYDHNYSQVNISSPNYKKLAEAYSINGSLITSLKGLDDLDKIINRKGPELIEFHVQKEDNVFPMVPGGKSLGETIIS